MSSSATITAETAPRDAASILKIGRYQLRKLAESIGLLETEEQKGAFLSGSNEDMAKSIEMKLKELDGVGGKKSTSTKREPVTAPAATTATQAPAAKAPATKAASGNGTIGITELLEAIATLAGKVEELADEVSTISETQERIESAVRGGNRLQFVGTNLSLMLAEQVLGGAPRNEVLADAVGDVEMTLKAIQEIAPSLLTPEEETDEGDETGNG